MSNIIKLRKGLTVKLKGVAKPETGRLGPAEVYGICPGDFEGVKPKVEVKEGQSVKAGDVLFTNKDFPEVKYCSPVSGTVKGVVRGERRRVLAIEITPSQENEYRDFGVKDISALSAEEAKALLLEGGMLGQFRQLPYDVCATSDAQPKGIFVSAFRDMPLAADFNYEIEGNEKAFEAGLQVLAKIAPTHVSFHKTQTALIKKFKSSEYQQHIFDGKCPAGNASVQVNNIDPVNKGETVWMVDPMVVVFIGRLVNEGKYDVHRRIAIVGSCVTSAGYIETLPGQTMQHMLEGNLVRTDHIRIINGNPLVGTKTSFEGYLSSAVSEVTVMPEGDNVEEVRGWIMPRSKQISFSRTYLPWLLSHSRKYDVDARIKGGQRHMIMSGEYDRVFPMDIYPEQLIKAIIAGDIDRQEQLGIYEVTPQDFALAEFLCSSKMELQRIVREGLDKLRKENM